MDYFAHSAPEGSDAAWQDLDVHLEKVAREAAVMARPFGLERAAFMAGLFHDLGKYTDEFQKRLQGLNIRVDHSTAGARVLFDLAQGRDKVMVEIIAYGILGHHAGLPDRDNDGAASFDDRMARPVVVDPVWREELSPQIGGLAPDWLTTLPKDAETVSFALSFLGRMIFSCLVDADFKDTEAYYAPLEGYEPDRDWPTLQSLLPDLLARYENHMAGLSGKADDLNRFRRDILAHVRGKAEMAPGLFTLTVPTGGGKTLASLGFALDHAKIHGHSRIIYAIPFTSIIDQTAAVFRGVLGEDQVLEQHSAIDEERYEKEPRQQRDKLKLAMEDWAAPVVVTTNVQLFESLFAARPSRARKLHNIAGSIIILDEAQTLPRPFLLPVMRVLDELAARYGCTIVLCTATQPALGRGPAFPEGLPLAGRELAPDPARLATRLARASIRHAGAMNDDALVAALRDHEQALVIVNSRKHALDLYRQAQAEGLSGLVHLTTRQHATDRRALLAEVRARLKAGEPCRLIATSLIEAGVDVDFPVGFRAEAGLDQIVQAAGRVNREGKNRCEDSLLTVFTAPDHPPPAEIKGLIGDMKRIIGKHEDLAALAAIEDYFGEVYWRVGAGLDGKAILPDITFASSGTRFQYRSIAAKFRMIESGLVPVIVATDERAHNYVEQLGIASLSSGKIARELQSYTVPVPPKARDVLITSGNAGYAHPTLRGDQFAVLSDKSGLYTREIGLLWENADYLSVENSIL